MTLRLLTGPALEPVTLGEAKAHLRIDATDEDAFIASLITTARLQIETALDMALITQQQQWLGDDWPDGNIVELPLRPLQSIDAIRVRNIDNIASVLDPDSYTVDTASALPRIASQTGDWPQPGATLNGIEIDITAGFGARADDVPQNICQALLMLTAFWFEHRDPTTAEDRRPLPEAVSDLLTPYKAMRL